MALACPGTASIADGIYMHQKTETEQDNRLVKVFQTLSAAGLTLTKEKCQLSINQLEFIGMVGAV